MTRYRLSLRFTIPLLLTAVIAAAALWSLRDGSIRAEAQTRERIVGDLNRQMTRLQSTLEHAAAIGDWEWVQADIGVLGADPTVRVAVLADETGLVIASTRLAHIGLPLADAIGPAGTDGWRQLEAGVERAKHTLSGSVVTVDGERVALGLYPVELGVKSGDIRRTRIGALVMQVDTVRSIADAVAVVRREVLLYSLVLAAMVLVLAMFLHFRVTRRLARLARTTQGFASGELDARTEVSGHDEIGELELRFNEMASQRAAAERQLRHSQKMEAVGQLASGVAHDFNNLLMGIAGTAELAARKLSADSAARAHLLEIKAATDSGAGVTRRLLAFSRPSKHRGEPVEIDRVIASAEPMVRRLIGEDIRLVTSLQAGTYVACGDGEIEQMILNLAVNARDAMPDGGELVIATALAVAGCEHTEGTALESGAPHVALSVRDSGSGMEPAIADRAFEPFFTTKAVGKGTGLGLAGVYGIARAAGGRVELDSEPGRGTTITISLPEVEAPREVDDSPSIGGGRYETILVVEDEGLVRRTIDHYLSQAGYRVLQAADAEAAARLAGEHADEIKLLLTDVVLPDVSGPKLAAQLGELIPGLPVLFMSAHPHELLVADRRISERARVIQKPFGEAVLLRELFDILGGDADPARVESASILLVEDNALARAATAELLADEGFHVIAAECGQEALDAIDDLDGGVDIVIADLGLPDMRGDELVAELRRNDGGHRLFGVIYVSGDSSDDPVVESALTGDGASFLSKPFEFDELVREVRHHLDT